MNDIGKLKIALGTLVGDELPTQEELREYVARQRRVLHWVTDEEAEDAIRWFETVHGVTMMDYRKLQEAASSRGRRTHDRDRT